MLQEFNDRMTRFLIKRVSYVDKIGSLLMKANLIYLNYPVNDGPRYGYGAPPHPGLYEIINANRAAYKEVLTAFLDYKDYYTLIPRLPVEGDPLRPSWKNYGIGSFDALQIYAFLAMHRPAKYFEIGSGSSTKFAMQAIRDHGLKTRITSFDPHPRAEIDAICDRVVRKPIEQADPGLFSQLEAGDILFVDDGHRVFMNHGPTVFFMDILPELKPGVILGIHDIFLPYDYPPEWRRLYYTEQYLLAAVLLASPERFEIMLPCRFVSEDAELRAIMSPLWESPSLKGAETQGISFWARLR